MPILLIALAHSSQDGNLERLIGLFVVGHRRTAAARVPLAGCCGCGQRAQAAIGTNVFEVAQRG
jgi:hypothetical protein